MPQAGFESTIPASARPQTYALGRAVAEVGCMHLTRPISDAVYFRNIHSVCVCVVCVIEYVLRLSINVTFTYLSHTLFETVPSQLQGFNHFSLLT
jgi:hypothetical protein